MYLLDRQFNTERGFGMGIGLIETYQVILMRILLQSQFFMQLKSESYAFCYEVNFATLVITSVAILTSGIISIFIDFIYE